MPKGFPDPDRPMTMCEECDPHRVMAVSYLPEHTVRAHGHPLAGRRKAPKRPAKRRPTKNLPALTEAPRPLSEDHSNHVGNGEVKFVSQQIMLLLTDSEGREWVASPR